MATGRRCSAAHHVARCAGPRRDRHGRAVGLDGGQGAVGDVRAVARSLIFALLGQAGAAAVHVVDVLPSVRALLAHVVHQAVAAAEVHIAIELGRAAAAVITQGDGGLQGQVVLGGVLQVDGDADVGTEGLLHHVRDGHIVVHVTAGDRHGPQQDCREERRSIHQHALHASWVF